MLKTINLNYLKNFPSKIVCVGLNYKDHAKELNMDLPKNPILFLKPNTALIGNNDSIIYPDGVTRLDYEAELAIIISKECSRIKEKNALDYVDGFTCLNDVTARDLQGLDGQWTRAKGFDSFCPVGPRIVRNIDPDNLKIQAILNDRVMQDSNTSNMIFNVNCLIEFISHVMTLLPGDIIATGTPPGIGPMNKGDRIEIKIEGIDTLINQIK